MNIPRRFWEKSGVSPMSPEIPHIYKEPPKSVWVPKKERITEADVTWAIRPDGPASDPTRINEGIRHFASSVNPSVQVEYQNRGGGSTTTHTPSVQAGSTYKIQKVVPPLFPVETLLPLSRPRTHQNKSVETNPGLPESLASSSVYDQNDWTLVDNATQGSAISLPVTTTATAYYKIEQPQIMSARYAINDKVPTNAWTNPSIANPTDYLIDRQQTSYGTIIRPKIEANTNLKLEGYQNPNTPDASNKVRERLIIENVRPNFQIVVYDPSNHVATEVSANIREKQNIAVRAAIGAPISFTKVDGTKVLTRDYRWSAVNTNVGIDQVILTLQDPHIELERNVPLYASETNLSTPTDILQRLNKEYELEGKLSSYSRPTYSLPGSNEEGLRTVQDSTRLKSRLNFGSYDNQSSNLPVWTHKLPAVQVNGTKDNYMSREKSNAFWERSQRIF